MYIMLLCWQSGVRTGLQTSPHNKDYTTCLQQVYKQVYNKSTKQVYRQVCKQVYIQVYKQVYRQVYMTTAHNSFHQSLKLMEAIMDKSIVMQTFRTRAMHDFSLHLSTRVFPRMSEMRANLYGTCCRCDNWQLCTTEACHACQTLFQAHAIESCQLHK